MAGGTTDGLGLALNIAAMLIAFLALIALANGVLGGIHNRIGLAWLPSSLPQIFGTLFAPIARLIGIPWPDCPSIGNLLGPPTPLNYLLAFSPTAAHRTCIPPRLFP